MKTAHMEMIRRFEVMMETERPDMCLDRLNPPDHPDLAPYFGYKDGNVAFAWFVWNYAIKQEKERNHFRFLDDDM